MLEIICGCHYDSVIYYLTWKDLSWIYCKYILTNWTIIRWKNIMNKDSFLQRPKSRFDWINNNLWKDYWSIIKLNIVEMFCSTCRQRVKLKKSKWPKKGQRTRQKAHHPSSFHCCHRQDPSHVSVLSWSSLSVRAPVRSVFGVVCPRKLFERERAAEQGVTRYTQLV